MKFLVFLPLVLVATPAIAEKTACEAHFFATDEVSFATRLGDFGLLSEVLAGSAPPEEQIQQQITPDVQVNIAKALIKKRGLLEGFELVAQEGFVDFKTATKQKARITNSSQSCYVEIVVNYIQFSDSVLTKKKIGVHFVTRDFRDRPDRPKVRKLGGAAPLKPHIQHDKNSSEIVSIDFVAAYTEAFDAAIERFWKL